MLKKKPDKYKISKTLVFMWFLMPIFMVLYDLYMGTTGQFPTLEDIYGKYGGYGWATFTDHQYTWSVLFNALGVITLIHSGTLYVDQLKELRRSNQKPGMNIIIPGLLVVFVILSTLNEIFFVPNQGTLYALADGLVYVVLVAIYFLATTLYETKIKQTLIKLYCYMTVGLTSIQLLQHFKVLWIFSIFPSIDASVFQQFNYFGYVLCMALLGFAGLYLYENTQKKRIVYCGCFGYLLVCLMYNNTFGAYLATFIALPIVYIFYWLHFDRHIGSEDLGVLLMFYIGSLIGATGIIPGTENFGPSIFGFMSDMEVLSNKTEGKIGAVGTGRMQLWMDTFQRILQKPITGFGPSGFTLKNGIANMDSPHNEYLQLAGYLGVPVLATYLVGVFGIVKECWIAIRKLSATAMIMAGIVLVYMISACFGNMSLMTYPFAGCFLGLLYNEMIKCKKSAEIKGVENSKESEASVEEGKDGSVETEEAEVNTDCREFVCTENGECRDAAI